MLCARRRLDNRGSTVICMQLKKCNLHEPEAILDHLIVLHQDTVSYCALLAVIFPHSDFKFIAEISRHTHR